MNRFYVNMDHVRNPKQTLDKSKKPGSKSLFLAFSMHATGTYRLFDRKTVNEYLYRLAIMFRHYNIVPNFFTNDSLIGYTDRGVKSELCLKDVIEHLGIELSDSPSDMVSRNEWCGKIETYWRNAMMVGVFTGVPILDQRVVGLNRFVIGSNKPMPITAEFEKTAELLAREAMKTIGDKAFEELSLRVAERVKSLEEYRAHMATKPRHIFNYLEMSMDLKKKIYMEMYPNFPIEKYDIMDEINDPDSTFANLIHLGWLWANGYVAVYEVTIGDKHAHTAEVDERVDFSYERFDGLNHLGFGVNLYDTYYEYGVDKIAHYLKEE
jgi:hypothetical protein